MKDLNILFLINMFSGMGYSLVAPLFPLLGEEDGLNEELIGWIISLYPIASTAFTPFVPLMCKKYPRIKLLLFSTFFEATCTLLYGFLNYISSFPLLITSVFIIRTLHGIASGIIGILVYSLTYSLSSESELQIALGNLEIGYCLGASAGPIFASFFYKIGGYPLPFFVLGIFFYISVYLTKKISTEKIENENEIEEESPFMKFLYYWDINVILLALILGMVACTYYYPCLTYHLMNNYHLSASISSLFFIIPIIFYVIGLQTLDFFTNKIGIYATSSIGLFLAAISCLFTYPTPPLPKKIIFVIFGFVIKGLGQAPIFVPTLVAMTKKIKDIDNNVDELTANDISSAMYNLCVDVGDFIGPIIGGFLSNRFGFNFCNFVVALVIGIYSFIFAKHFYKNILENLNKNDIDNLKELEEVNIDKNKEKNDLNKSCEYSFSPSFYGFKFESLRKNKYLSFNNRRKERSNSKTSLFSSLTS